MIMLRNYSAPRRMTRGRSLFWQGAPGGEGQNRERLANLRRAHKETEAATGSASRTTELRQWWDSA